MESFEKGLRLLDLLAQRSPPALKGARIMRQLELRILHEWRVDEENYNLAVASTESSQAPLGTATEFSSSSPSGFQEDRSSEETLRTIHGQDFMAAGWEPFSTGADMSWFFEDSMFQNAGVGDLGMDFGIGFAGDYDGI
jgi:hypothetical protein